MIDISPPQGLHFFQLLNLHNFPWLFPWTFPVFQDLRISCHLWKFSNLSLFEGIFDLTHFISYKTLVSTKICAVHTIQLLVSILLCCCFDICSTKVNKTLIFHDFPWPTIKFRDLPGLENEIVKFHDFPGFPWPVQTLLQ